MDCNKLKENCQDSKRLGTIYLIINLINGKKYVGQTIQTLNNRIKQHRNCKKKRGIDAAIQKYGWENFTVDTIEICPRDLLNEREVFWITFHNCKYPDGYNLTAGGSGSKGFSPSKETRAKISKSLKGRPTSRKGKPLSEEHKAKLSANHADFKGVNHPFYGKHHSPETCAKLSEFNKGKPSPNKGKKMSNESKMKISIANKGRTSPNKGKKMSEEQKLKLSISHKAYWEKKKSEKNLENQKD